MAAIATQPLGAAITFSSAAGGGDTVKAGDGNTLIVNNTDASAHTFTLVTPGTYFGQSVGDFTSPSIPAGGFYAMRLPYALYADANGDVAVSYSSATGMKLAVVTA